MELRRVGRIGWVLAAVVAVTIGCGEGPDAGTAAQLAELEQEVAALEKERAAAEAELDAAVPMAGAPEIDQQGQPLTEIPEVPAVPVDRAEGDCPSKRFARVRSWTGSDCGSYEAEISAWSERCTAECDRGTTDRRAVEIAAAECAAFCSGKGCGSSVTFVPPPDGCAAYDCYEPAERCPAPECPKREYCSLLDGNRVWNCFCRDLMPT